MAMRISVTNNVTAEGVRWHVIERGKILRVGTANTELQARAAPISCQLGGDRGDFAGDERRTGGDASGSHTV